MAHSGRFFHVGNASPPVVRAAFGVGDGKDDELFVFYSVGDVVLAKTRGEVHAPDSALADVVEEGIRANGVTRQEVTLFEG